MCALYLDVFLSRFLSGDRASFPLMDAGPTQEAIFQDRLVRVRMKNEA